MAIKSHKQCNRCILLDIQEMAVANGCTMLTRVSNSQGCVEVYVHPNSEELDETIDGKHHMGFLLAPTEECICEATEDRPA